MKNKFQYRLIGVLAGTFCLAILACTGTGCVSDDSEAAYLYEQADAYRGGAMWDKWWKVLVPGVKEGIEPGKTVQVGDEEMKSSLSADNPLYATNPNGNTRSGSQTWRCKECHGWDYLGVDGAYGGGSHQTGFLGVMASKDRPVAELFNIIRDGNGLGPGHTFGRVLSDRDVADLVKFIREGAINTALVVAPDGSSTGEAGKGKDLFGASCAKCHGGDGRKINFKEGEYASEYLENLSHGNPYEFVHKARFGQPDGEMPNGAVEGYLLKDVADILAYAQSLAVPGLEEASAVRGGALWDEWWAVNGADPPAATNPLYENPAYNTLGGGKSGSTTWRCKECHGWDYKGVDGAYAAGSHATGMKGVLDAADLSPAQLIDIIGAGNLRTGGHQAGHEFRQDGLLSAGDVEDLALFIKQELVDDADYISMVTKRSKGNAVLGEGLYNGNCATCHGTDGMNVNFEHEEAAGKAEYVGTVARDNPFELTNKIRFGQPGSDEHAKEIKEEYGIFSGHMPNMFDAGYSNDDVAALVAYAQTLPGSKERGGIVWDRWWKASMAAEPIEPGKSITLEDGTEIDSSLVSDNPQYLASPVPNTRRGSQTWRCKECHGWDYKGVDGAYGSGSHLTGFAGVFAAKDKPYDDLYNAVAYGRFASGSNGNHAFLPLLGEDLVRDAIHFIQNTVDVERELVFLTGPRKKEVKATYVPYDEVTQPDGMKARTRDANIIGGRIKFEQNCAGCHGKDGRAINFKEGEGGEEYPGDIARENPWELLNKIQSGQPGSDPMMPNAAGKYYSVDDLADLLLYIQQLP